MRKLFKIHSIKTKISSIIVLTFLVTSFLSISFVIIKYKKVVIQGLELKGNSLAEMLAYNISPGLEFADTQSVEDGIQGVKPDKDFTYVRVYDSSGKEFYSFISGEAEEVNHRGNKDKISHGEEIVTINKPIYSHQKRIGHLVLALSLTDLNQEISRGRKWIILINLGIIFFGVLVVNYLGNRFIRPILQLKDAVQQLSSGETEVTVKVETEDEIGSLAKAFNQMTIDLKKSREQLIQQEKMASVGQLAAGAAHELNNPLAGILGYSQFALEKITKKTLKDLSEDDICAYTQYLKDIEHQSQRCKTIVQNLLKFARSSTKVPFEPLDLNSVLKDTLVFLSHQMDMNKIELIVNLADSPLEVMGHFNQLQQVFTNIILNAIQTMTEGGKLIISTQKMEQKDSLPERVEISIQDTGCGIPEDNLNKIFEPFFTTKKVGEGTGLGLPVSYGIIKEHKGEISVESQVGKGTTFILWIPVFYIEKRCEDKQEKKVLKKV